MRKGYYTLDPDSTNEKLIFNQTVTLRDTWAKIKDK
jgi:glutaminyl-tRNA synthetase